MSRLPTDGPTLTAPRGRPAAHAGFADDGSLRFENDPGSCEHGRGAGATPIARLFDARTGALLLDSGGWSSGRVVPQSDGTLLIALDHRERQTVYRVDPPAATFRDLATTGPERTLSELDAAAAEARAACDDPANAHVARRVAPDGSLLVDLAAAEWSNSHWVYAPRVIEIATGRVVLDLWGSDWDAVPSFPRRQAVHLSLRRYHHGGGAEAEIDLATGRHTVFEPAGSVSGPIGEILAALEPAARREAAKAPPRRQIAPPRPTARPLLTALLILLGALAAIALMTVIARHTRADPPPQKLDTIPPMPRFDDAPRPRFTPRGRPGA